MWKRYGSTAPRPNPHERSFHPGDGTKETALSADDVSAGHDDGAAGGGADPLRDVGQSSHRSGHRPAGSGVSVDLPDVPVGGAAASAMPAAKAPDHVDDALIHAAASPERHRVNPSRMAAKATGRLDIVPGPQIADPKPVTSFGKSNDVLVLFHRPTLDRSVRCRPWISTHGCREKIDLEKTGVFCTVGLADSKSYRSIGVVE